MRFGRLLCNGNENPIGTGKEILLNWCYLPDDGTRGEFQKCYRVTVEGEGEGVCFDSGVIEGEEMSYVLSDYMTVESGKRYRWHVTAQTGTLPQRGSAQTIISGEQFWETAIDDLDQAGYLINDPEKTDGSAPIFVRRFTCPAGKIVRARAYVYGLGLIDCKINGRPCDDAFLMPPNTRYDSVCLFETFDLTEHLRPGDNCFTVQLGNGYYPPDSGYASYTRYGYYYTAAVGLRAVLEFTCEDGTVRRMETDENWSWHNSGVSANGLYYGEEYDARPAEYPEYPVLVRNDQAPKGKLLPSEMPRIRVWRAIRPVSCWETGEGTVYDFGEVLQGVVRMEVQAKVGTVITLQHSELIHPDGTLNPMTNRYARATDQYTCAGTGKETYTPTFTYHGFRYVLVKGAEAVEKLMLTALFLSADVKSVGTFQCSDPTINRIHANCRQSMRGNFVSIPTDCPVRDERTPCLMDSQMYEQAAIANFSMHSYYRKWFEDAVLTEKGGNPDWHGDIIMLCYRLYWYYGDLWPARTYYEQLKERVVYWVEHSDNGVWSEGYGDWCLPNDGSWESYGQCQIGVNTSLLYSYTEILAEFACIFGKDEDAALFSEYGRKISAGLLASKWKEDGTIATGRQPEMVLPLYFGVLSKEAGEKTAAALRRRVEMDGHLDTGGFGTMALLEVLSDTGNADLAYRILTEPSYPGYGWQIATGATSLWEQWAYKGPMHSHSHAMLAGIDASFYRVFCGIRPTSPAYRTFTVAPVLPKEMSFAQGEMETYSGTIGVKVERISGGISVTVTVPPNCRAELTLPEIENYDACLLYDGERILEKKRKWQLSGGSYHFRLVPKSLVEALYE